MAKADCLSLSIWRRLVHPLAWFLPGFHGLPTRPFPLPDDVQGRPTPSGHQSEELSCQMNQLWPGHPLGRHWPDRRLPGRDWPGRRLPGAVNCGQAVTCGRAVNCARAVACRAVPHLCWTHNWSTDINLKLPGRRRDHSDSSVLRRLDDLGRQLHFSSGDVRMSGLIGALSSSLMKTGR